MKKRIFVALGGISLLGGLLTAATTANAANDPLPSGPWRTCISETDFYCIDSVSVDDGRGTKVDLKWVASGTVNPWLAAPAAPAAATTDTAATAPAATTDAAAAAPAPAPAAIVPAEVETKAGTLANGTIITRSGRWS